MLTPQIQLQVAKEQTQELRVINVEPDAVVDAMDVQANVRRGVHLGVTAVVPVVVFQDALADVILLVLEIVKHTVLTQETMEQQETHTDAMVQFVQEAVIRDVKTLVKMGVKTDVSQGVKTLVKQIARETATDVQQLATEGVLGTVKGAQGALVVVKGNVKVNVIHFVQALVDLVVQATVLEDVLTHVTQLVLEDVTQTAHLRVLERAQEIVKIGVKVAVIQLVVQHVLDNVKQIVKMLVQDALQHVLEIVVEHVEPLALERAGLLVVLNVEQDVLQLALTLV